MPRLLMLPAAPVIPMDHGRVRLDTKFVAGMAYICANWPGSVTCVLRQGAGAIPFGADYDPADLPFGLTVLPQNAVLPPVLLNECDIVEASADMHTDLDLGPRSAGNRARRVLVIEYSLATRLQILRLDRQMSMARKVKSAVWLLLQERRRCRAMRQADAVQTNGYPAYDTYRGLNDNTLLYLDNRMREGMFSNPDEIAQRTASLRGGGPLRLINSGRLDPMKGAHDLIPVARALAGLGVNFTLDIYGTGSLAAELRSQIDGCGLADKVRLHKPVDFETELVPISRRDADLFLSCHRQSDPSCTYIEAMGCGLPVAGYENAMLARLVTEAQAGWTVPVGDTSALAQKIAQAAADPATVEAAACSALAFARQHDFTAEFSLRRNQLIDLVKAA